MRRTWGLTGITVVAMITAAVYGGGDGEPSPTSPADPGDPSVVAAGIGLASFDACDGLVDHLVTSASRADPWGGPLTRAFGADGDIALEAGNEAGGAADTAAPAAPTTDVSDTNVQVAGVDEPDLVETDGTRLFTAMDGVLRVVDVSTPAQPALVAEVPLGGGGGGDAQLLLHENRLLVLTSAWGEVRPLLERSADLVPPGSPVTTLRLFDVSDDTPRLIAEAGIEGSLVAGRGIDGTVHLVLQHSPQPVPAAAMDEVWSATDRQTAATALTEALAGTGASDWLPAMTHVDASGAVTTGRAVDCTAVQRTSEVTDTTMLEVLTFDLADSDLAPEGTAAVLTNAATVTASADELVVATPVWPRFDGPLPVEPGIAVEPEPDMIAPEPPRPERMTTRLHLFSLSDGGATYAASGEVDGQVLNQFSMSLHAGHLRVATTVGDAWGGQQSESGITVLRQVNDRLDVVGSIAGLGLGERIHAVRFLGDTAYVVTFRQIDPLYTIDLSDPTAPRYVGELKITGYSAYLHPLDGQRLLGVGQEATEQGRRLGTQISLFDVRPADPVLESQVMLPDSNTEIEWDHHAFLYHDGTLVVPFERWLPAPTTDRPSGHEAGAMVIGVDGKQLTLRGTVVHGAGGADPWRTSIRRAVVVDGTLLTVSRGAVEAVSLDSLSSTGSVAW